MLGKTGPVFLSVRTEREFYHFVTIVTLSDRHLTGARLKVLKITLLASGGGRKELEDGPGYDAAEEGKGTG